MYAAGTQRGLAYLRAAGLRRSLAAAVTAAFDWTFDWRYGTHTAGRAANVAGPAQAEPYQPVRVRPLRRMLARLALLPENGFVDLGCGKGRALLIACEYGFHSVVGVELDEALCQTARANVEQFRARTGCSARVRVEHGDARDYRPRARDTVFFLFNPFGPDVVRACLDNLRASVAAAPRRIWLIYVYPTCADVVDEHGLLARHTTHVLGGDEYAVYATR